MKHTDPTEFDGPRARLVREAVAYAFNVSPDEMIAPTRRSSSVALARQVAMYLTHVAFELSLSQVAAFFGRDRTTASHACHVVEDRRDDPEKTDGMTPNSMPVSTGWKGFCGPRRTRPLL